MKLPFIFKYVLLLFYNNHLIYMDDEAETTPKNIINCRERNRLLGTDKDDKYDLTEIELNVDIIIQCHYCNENDADGPKVWYKIEQSNTTPHEIQLGMNANNSLNRIFVTLDHSLTIRNATIDDGGIYYCQGNGVQESENMYNYIVDIVFDNSTPPEKGNISDWLQYHDDYFVPTNNLFLTSDGTEYARLRNDLNVRLEVITEWEANFGPCEVCGRPQGEGVQEKLGQCRIKIEPFEEGQIVLNNTAKLNYLLNCSQVSCRSLLLQEYFPGIFNVTVWLPNFKLLQHCDGICNPDAEGVNRGWKFGSSKGFKYRKTFVLDEGAHFTVVCPESTLDNTVIWRRNGKVLKQGESFITSGKDESEPHIIVDTFNTLYLIDVTTEQDGNYTCQVDDIRMQQVRVFVVSKTQIVTRELLRHMKYLGFVLLLTSSCYCAGITAACKRRHRFKGYAEVATEATGTV